MLCQLPFKRTASIFLNPGNIVITPPSSAILYGPTVSNTGTFGQLYNDRFGLYPKCVTVNFVELSCDESLIPSLPSAFTITARVLTGVTGYYGQTYEMANANFVKVTSMDWSTPTKRSGSTVTFSWRFIGLTVNSWTLPASLTGMAVTIRG